MNAIPISSENAEGKFGPALRCVKDENKSLCCIISLYNSLRVCVAVYLKHRLNPSIVVVFEISSRRSVFV